MPKRFHVGVKRGLMVLIKMLMGKEYFAFNYLERMKDPKVFDLGENPFDPEHVCMFVGDWGITASMGDMVGTLLTEFLTAPHDGEDEFPIKELLVYKFKTDSGHDIVLGFRNALGSYYVSFGYTDYSGEGGRGYKDLRSLFELLAKVFEIPLTEKVFEDNSAFKRLEELYLKVEWKEFQRESV